MQTLYNSLIFCFFMSYIVTVKNKIDEKNNKNSQKKVKRLLTMDHLENAA